MSSTEVCLVWSAELEMGETVQQHENLGVATGSLKGDVGIPFMI